MTQEDEEHLQRIVEAVSEIFDTYMLISCDHQSIVHVSPKLEHLLHRNANEIAQLAESKGMTDVGFLFGELTSASSIAALTSALGHRQTTSIDAVLYNAQGEAFNAQLDIRAVNVGQPEVNFIIVAVTDVVQYTKPTPSLEPSLRSTHLKEEVILSSANRWTQVFSLFTLRPHSTQRRLWDWLIFVATTYACTTSTYNFSFYTNELRGFVEVLGNFVVCLLLVIDIIVSILSPFVNGKGEIVDDRRAIFMNYSRGWLVVDLVAAAPYELAQYMFVKRQYALSLEMLRCVKMLHWRRIWLEYSRHYAISLMINFTVYLLLAHCFACVWFLIGSYEWYYDEKRWNVGWIYRLVRALARAPLTNKPVDYQELDPDKLIYYWTSLYFSMTMLTTVGFGNEAPNTINEKIAACTAMPIFAIANAVVFANVINVIARIYNRRQSLDLQHSEMEAFFKVYDVPKSVRMKVEQYYRASWTVRRGVNHEKLVSDMPDDVRSEVLLYVYRSLLRLSAFVHLPRDCRKRIALTIRTTFFNTGDYLLRAGDSPRNYFFLHRGRLNVSNQETNHSEIIDCNSLIGGDLTRLVFHNGKSSFDVVALTPCDVYTLKVDDLVYVLSVYPEVATDFADKLEGDLAINLITYVVTQAEKENRERNKHSALKALTDMPLQVMQALSVTNVARNPHPAEPQLNHVTSIRVNKPSTMANTAGEPRNEEVVMADECSTTVEDDLQTVLHALRNCVDLMSDQIHLAEYELEIARSKREAMLKNMLSVDTKVGFEQAMHTSREGLLDGMGVLALARDEN